MLQKQLTTSWGRGIGIGLILMALVTAFALPALQRQTIRHAGREAKFSVIIETTWPQAKFVTYLHELPRKYTLAAIPIDGLSINNQTVPQPVSILILVQGSIALSPLSFPPTTHPGTGSMAINWTIAHEYGVKPGQSVLVQPLQKGPKDWHVVGPVQRVAPIPENLWNGVNATIWNPQMGLSLIRGMAKKAQVPIWIMTTSPALIGSHALPLGSTHLVLARTVLVTRALRTVVRNPGWSALSGILWIGGMVTIVRSRIKEWRPWLLGSGVTLSVTVYVLWHGLLGFTLIPISLTQLGIVAAMLWGVTWAIVAVSQGLVKHYFIPSGPSPSSADSIDDWSQFHPQD